MHQAQRAYIIQTIGPPLMKEGTIDIYWVPSERRVAYRTAIPTMRKIKRLPDGAIHVGRYSHPCPADLYVGDIEAILEDLHPRPPQGGVEARQVAA